MSQARDVRTLWPRLTRRSMVATVPLAATAFVAACGSQATGNAPEIKAGPKQNIEWWTGWGASQDNGLRQVQDAANAQSRTYQVTWTRTPSVAKKLAEVIVAGSPPDVEA